MNIFQEAVSLAPKIGIDPETEFDEYEFLLSTVNINEIDPKKKLILDGENRTAGGMDKTF